MYKINIVYIEETIGGNLISQLCYADELCLIARSSPVMQHLLNKCDVYAASHLLLYNATKLFLNP